MQKTITKLQLLAITLFQFSSAAQCQVINGNVDKPIKIEISAKPVGFDDKPCSVLIAFPDGSKNTSFLAIQTSL